MPSPQTAPALFTQPGPAVPPVAWAAPPAILYGTPLDATQLNATTPVSGTMAYTPVAGSVLNAGARTLSVVFPPTNLTLYPKVTASVPLTVPTATPTITWATPTAL